MTGCVRELRSERSEWIFFWYLFTIVRKKCTQIAHSAVAERTHSWIETEQTYVTTSTDSISRKLQPIYKSQHRSRLHACWAQSPFLSLARMQLPLSQLELTRKIPQESRLTGKVLPWKSGIVFEVFPECLVKNSRPCHTIQHRRSYDKSDKNNATDIYL
jgi:hypothetical protein